MQQYLPIIQIIISVLLIVSILFQQRGSDGSAILGGSGGGNYYKKRGFSKVIFIASIVLAVLFLASAFTSLLI